MPYRHVINYHGLNLQSVAADQLCVTLWRQSTSIQIQYLNKLYMSA